MSGNTFREVFLEKWMVKVVFEEKYHEIGFKTKLLETNIH